MPELQLRGCSTRPLVGYLKALGVLRVIGTQIAGDIRGRWSPEGVFELRSAVGNDDLHNFLLSGYRPLPILSPWNGRSGFYAKANPAAVGNLTRIAEADDPRLRHYGALIEQTREILGELGIKQKPENADKERLIRALRRRWPDESLQWLDTAVALAGDGLQFPALLGSGGNDGSYDFSSNFMAAIAGAVLGDRDRSAALLAASLDDAAEPLERSNLAFLALDASPTNSPNGEAPSLGNPWDLILGLEGVVLLTAGATRRHGSNIPSNLAAPFTVRQTSAGYGSAVDGESGRAELWLPLWERWASVGELATLAREARAQVGGTRRRQVTSGLDFARAAGELGVARGVSAFERYALLERAGNATLAVSVGRIEVEDRLGAKALDGIESWLGSLERLAHDERCPQGPRIAIRRLRKAAVEMAERDDPRLVCATLEAIGDVETTLSRSRTAGEKVRPLNAASAAPWIAAATPEGTDLSPEFAIAIAIASLRDGNGSTKLPALRDYLHGTKRGERGTERDPERRNVVVGNDPVALLAAIGARRHLDAGRSGRGTATNGPDESGAGAGRTPLDFAHGIWAPLGAVRLFAADRLDNKRILALVRGLSVLRYSGGRPTPLPKFNHRGAPHPPLDLLELAWRKPLPEGQNDRTRDERIRRGAEPAALGARPGWAARLATGATRTVIEDANRRLLMAGLPPRLSPSDLVIDGSHELRLGRRLGAALLVHIGPYDIRTLTRTQIVSEEADDQNREGAP